MADPRSEGEDRARGRYAAFDPFGALVARRERYTAEGGTDPYTGEEYDETTASARGLVPGLARRRARRRAEREQRKEREHERDLAWFQGMEDLGAENLGLADALAGDVPDVLALMGGATESELAGAQADQASIDAQMRALQELEGTAGQFRSIYDQGGYTDVERGQIDQALAQAGREDAARQAAIRQQMAMTGMGNSGLQYAQQMSSQQGAANRGAAAATDIATAAQMRALQALETGGRFTGQAGQMAGQARGQSFDEEATRRGAADEFSARRGDAAAGRFGMQTQAADRQMGARSAEQQRLWQERVNQMDKKRAKTAAAMGAAQAGAQAAPW